MIGFGSKNPGSIFSQPMAGKIVGINRFRKPPTLRWCGAPQHVAPNPGAGYIQQLVKKLSIDLTNARNDFLFPISGTILWAYRVFNQADGSPNTTANFAVRIADIGADQLNWYGGNGVEGIPFSKIYFSNPATAQVTLELAYFTDTADKPARFF